MTMKRVTVLFLLICCVLGFCGCSGGNSEPETVLIVDVASEGLFLPCTDGTYIAVFDNEGPIILHPKADDYSVFEGLTAGDRVKVNHGIILYTYPGSTGITKIEKLSDGNSADIPADVIAGLEECGLKVLLDETAPEKVEKAEPSYVYPYLEEEMPAEYFLTKEQTLSFDYDSETGVCNVHGPEEIAFIIEDADVQAVIKVSDGVYLFTNCCGHGTECWMEELYMIEAPDYKPIKVLSYDTIVETVENRVTHKYDKAYDVLILDTDSGKHEEIFFRKYLNYSNSSFVGISFGDIARIEFFDGKPWLYMLGAIQTSERPITFEYTVGITAPINLEDFRIGEINIFAINTLEALQDNDFYEDLEHIPFFYCYRDINHDGCKDKLVVSAEIMSDEYSGSFEEAMQEVMEVCKVSVYGGLYGEYGYNEPARYPITDDTNLSFIYGPTHDINGQMFVTTVDGEDYLVETSLWSGQGESYYHYKVFFGDKYREFIIDEKDITFEFDNPPENIAEFWDGLYKWINDSSILLIATDMDSEPMVYYSTTENVLSPTVFYDKKRY